MRYVVMAVVAGLSLSACSSPMSLGEYAGEVEHLVETMNERLDAGEPALAPDSNLEQAQAYFADRVDARREFLDAFTSLDPPDEVEDLHATALDIVTRLTSAESDLADLVAAAQTFDEARQVWTTPQGGVFEALDEEAQAMCAAAQRSLNATEDRDAFADTPWIPAEMKDVVEVTFRCRS